MALSLPMHADGGVHKEFDELAQEKRKNALLRDQVHQLRSMLVSVSAEAETQEECITNKLMRSLLTMKKEKERLAREVEQEEECITNSLQTKLRAEAAQVAALQDRLDQVTVEKNALELVITDKVALILDLEKEQEFIVSLPRSLHRLF
jgi:coiled-coil domain-containing protein 6